MMTSLAVSDLLPIKLDFESPMIESSSTLIDAEPISKSLVTRSGGTGKKYLIVIEHDLSYWNQIANMLCEIRGQWIIVQSEQAAELVNEEAKIKGQCYVAMINSDQWRRFIPRLIYSQQNPE